MTLNRSSSKFIDFGMIFGYVRRTVWLPTLIFLGFFFAMPVALAIQLQNAVIGVNTQWESLALYAFTATNPMVKFIIVLSAIVCGLVLFSYMHSQRKVDFYHSLPISRNKLFVNTYLAGLFHVLIPYFVAILLSFAVLISNSALGHMDWSTCFAGIGTHLLGFLAIYSFVVLAAVLSGNVVVNFLVTGVLLGIGPVAVGMYSWVMNTFYEHFYSVMFDTMQWVSYVSPFMRYVIIDGYSFSLTWADALGLFLFAAVAFVLSLFLYKKRASEKAGGAIAFKYAKPILKYPVIAVCAIGLGMILYDVSRNSHFWLYFGFVLGGVIASRIIEIIYAFDFKAIKKHWVSLAVFAAVFGCIMAVPIADLTNFDEYHPEAEKVAKVQLNLGHIDAFAQQKEYHFNARYSGNNYQHSFVSFSEAEEIERALALTEKVLANAKANKEDEENAADIYAGPGERGSSISVGVIYTLKNGKTVERYYRYHPLDVVGDEISALVDSNTYKEQVFTDLNKNIEEVLIGNIAAFEASSAENNFNLKSLNLIARQKLFNIYKEEFLSLSSKEMKNAMPIGSIELNYAVGPDDSTRKNRDIVLGKENSFTYSVYYPIYASFTNTLHELQALGLDTALFESNAEHITSIDITDRTKYHQDMQEREKTMVMQENSGFQVQVTEQVAISSVETKTIRDKAEIAEILAKSYTEQAYQYNFFTQPNTYIDIYVNYISAYSDYGAVTRYFPWQGY